MKWGELRPGDMFVCDDVGWLVLSAVSVLPTSGVVRLTFLLMFGGSNGQRLAVETWMKGDEIPQKSYVVRHVVG